MVKQHGKWMIAGPIFLALMACAMAPQTAQEQFQQALPNYEQLRKKEVERIRYTTGDRFTLNQCGNEVVCMSDDDFRQNEHDIAQLQTLLEKSQDEIQTLTSANNSVVDVVIRKDLEIQELRLAIRELREQLKDERSQRGWQKWLERLGWFGGVILFKEVTE